MKLHRFDGRLGMVGFGSIGQGVLPLLLRHLDLAPWQVQAVTRGETLGAGGHPSPPTG